MPTENRSSSTGMVSVPRDLLERATNNKYIDKERISIHSHEALFVIRGMLAQPSQQHQGEPVALPARRQWNGLGNTADNLKASAWNACLDKIAELGPLYTHADPAGPASLAVPEECPHIIVFDDHDRADEHFSGAGARPAALRRFEQISQSWNAHLFVRVARNSRDDRYPSATVADPAEVERLRARLAERDALLQKVLGHLKAGKPGEAQVALFNDLSASAEPSAPVEIDEMRDLLKSMTCSYRSAVQAGYDRITGLGGECDSVEKMLSDYPDYARARAALERKP
ncbi:hypothetical protein SJI00_02765 [Pseudomonas sp. RP23018S]|uniref:hypothetical protein n=1 Tax=Pseudomonas sp. RP23018S TaxID=3096037 RepID=UPI002ACA65BF|nr:hypothetical protein [Pseudomonas sp. RP23018S]MDZ5601700.1 hypothetical protein [Pseudomonas sp. RP23018S]